MNFNFSRLRFLSFKNEQKFKIIFKFIRFIEKNWESKDLKNHINSLKYLLSIYEDSPDCLNPLRDNLDESMNLSEFIKYITPLFKEKGLQLKDHHFEILHYDRETPSAPPLPLTVILDNLRSSYNVGSIFRTTETLQIEKLLLCGYTPKEGRVYRTAMGSVEKTNWEWMSSTKEAVLKMKGDGLKIYCLERTTKSKNIYVTEFSKPAAIIIGNETSGIDPEILDLGDEIVEIPVYGCKNSLNVGVSLGIVLSHISNQWRGSVL